MIFNMFATSTTKNGQTVRFLIGLNLYEFLDMFRPN